MSGAPSPFASSFQAPVVAMDQDFKDRLFDAIDQDGDGVITRDELAQALSGQFQASAAAATTSPPASAPVLSVFPTAPASSHSVEGPIVTAAPPSLPKIAAPAPSAPLIAAPAPSPPVVVPPTQTPVQTNVSRQASVMPPMTLAPSQLPSRISSAAPMAMPPSSVRVVVPPGPASMPPQSSVRVAVPPGPASMPAQHTFDEDAYGGGPANNAQMVFMPAPAPAMAPAASQMNATGPVQAGYMDDMVNFGKKGVFLAGPTGFMGIFPTLFTIFCFVIFVIPIWLTYHIGRDSQVKYWIGSLCSDVLLLPIIFLIVHLIHNNRGRPSKPAMIVALLGSCLMILLVADYTLLAAYSKGNLLKSRDCTSFTHKHDLQLQWANAKAFYNNCMQATAAKSGLTYDAAVSLYRIEDCIEYEDQKSINPDWAYLANLEETYACSGWCLHDQPLWTFKAVKDSCSQVVADVMFNKVQWTLTQVVVYTIIVLGFCSVGLLAAGPIFDSLGYSW